MKAAHRAELPQGLQNDACAITKLHKRPVADEGCAVRVAALFADAPSPREFDAALDAAHGTPAA
jgi:hypothetical protein